MKFIQNRCPQSELISILVTENYIFLLDNKPINATTAYQEIGISGSAVYSPSFLCMFNFYFNLAKHRNEKNLMIADVMSEQEKDAI